MTKSSSLQDESHGWLQLSNKTMIWLPGGAGAQPYCACGWSWRMPVSVSRKRGWRRGFGLAEIPSGFK